MVPIVDIRVARLRPAAVHTIKAETIEIALGLMTSLEDSRPKASTTGYVTMTMFRCIAEILEARYDCID